MNRGMRIFIGLVILAVSLALLAWSFWPTVHVSQAVTIPASDLVLPTP